MAQKQETLFRRTVRKDLLKLKKKWPIFYEAIQQRSIKGSPDFVLCIGGDFIALELKADSLARIHPLQEMKLREIERAGGRGLISYPGNWPEIYAWFGQLCEAVWQEEKDAICRLKSLSTT